MPVVSQVCVLSNNNLLERGKTKVIIKVETFDDGTHEINFRGTKVVFEVKGESVTFLPDLMLKGNTIKTFPCCPGFAIDSLFSKKVRLVFMRIPDVDGDILVLQDQDIDFQCSLGFYSEIPKRHEDLEDI